MGKYVSSFNSIQEAVEAMGLKSPHVAYVNGASNTDGLVYVNIGDDVDIIFEDNGSGEISGENAAIKIPFHFIALENSTVALTNNGNNAPDVEYSYDNETWTQWNYSALSLNAGEKLYFRGDNSNGFSKNISVYSTFNITGSVDVAGNFNSLVNTETSSETTIGQYCFYELFYQQKAVKNIKAYITYVGSDAFRQCSSLASFDTPNLTYAGNYAFQYCSSLSSFEAPNLTYIASSAFYNCTSLSSFEAPNLTYIASSAFYNCTSLSSFDAPNLIYVNSYAFQYCSSLSSFEAPNLTYVGNNAFWSCSSLSSFVAPNLTYVGGNAFQNCTSLSSFEAPNLTYIASSAFSYCSSLSSFEAPNLTYVGSDAFWDCTSLAHIGLSAITNIGDYAFAHIGDNTEDGCNVIINNVTPPQIANSIFCYPWESGMQSKVRSIQVPASAVDTYKTATNWTTVAQYITAIP